MHSSLANFKSEAILKSSAPTGTESTLGDSKIPTYVAGNNRERAILFIHDIKGWTNVNSRHLANLYAKEIDCTVYLPDFFGGEKTPQSDEELLSGRFDFAAFKARNDKPIRRPEIYAAARKLREHYPRLGVIGFCFGGWSGLDLASKDNNGLIDCGSIGHPAWVTEDEISNVGVPTQIIAPEVDGPFNPDLKKFANEELQKKGVMYNYVYFPGVEHRFASQPELDKELWKVSFERAQWQVCAWMKMFM